MSGAAMSCIESGEIRPHFEGYGRCHPIIFIHEFIADARNWEARARVQFSQITIPVLLAVGDEDKACLQINLVLKSASPVAGLLICPKTGHTIDLEQPAAFKAQVKEFLSAAERRRWLRSLLENEVGSPPERRTTAQLRFGGGQP
jgi:pimeloyl-ACP methyl ester carboxylesterase